MSFARHFYYVELLYHFDDSSTCFEPYIHVWFIAAHKNNFSSSFLFSSSSFTLFLIPLHSRSHFVDIHIKSHIFYCTHSTYSKSKTKRSPQCGVYKVIINQSTTNQIRWKKMLKNHRTLRHVNFPIAIECIS